MTAVPANAVAGETVENGTYAFAAKLDIGEGARSCSGALVDQQWVLTASSCFAENPAKGFKITAGAPKWKTTATVGRTDLTKPTGAVTDVVELVPYKEGWQRDLVMAKLAKPVTGVTPVAVGTGALRQGEELKVAGFGRTKSEWVPDRLGSASFTVDSVRDGSVAISPKNPADGAVCKGDTGGPAVRETGGRVELVAVNSTSWQGGCLGTDPSETRRGAVDTRVDDIGPWVQQVRSLPKRYVTASGDFNGDGKTDLAMLVDYGRNQAGHNQAALWVYTADGKGGFNEPRTVWETRAQDSWNWEASKLTAGDFNGDGKTDLAVLYNYGQTSDGRNETGLWTFTSKGSAGFEAPRRVWQSGSGSWNWDASKIVAGDFNGDGKTDLAVLYNYGQTSDGRNETGLITFTANDSNGFNDPRRVWESGKGSWNWNTSKLAAGDFNGDGKTDLAVLYGYGKTADGRNESALWFTANNSNGFNEPRKVWDSGKDSWNWEASKIVAGDFNGDGKTDLAVLYRYGLTSDGRNQTGLWVFDGSKNGFDAPHQVWDSGKDSWNWDASELAAGDFNGDGKADISITYNYGQGTDGRVQAGLWTFTGNGTGFNAPRRVWDNNLQR
ncbi:FG-GAP-like repeat-containing protein [Streptomyces sp. NBRC 110611]|uniref:FG-GAP-like repeat-containing protein n=1 Tax=Streptomyces sp. NBRC 110611 TaxID=1621259 RepID=UPI0015EFB7CA|nr:FG-GAP-like repeat-containing protein [Streptomyces sp. NBRC 110611]